MSSLSSREHKEIARVKGRRWTLNPIVSFCLLSTVALFILYIVAINYFGDAKNELLIEQRRAVQTNTLEVERAYYSEWLADVMGAAASDSFQSLSSILLKSVVLVPESGTMVADLWMSLHKGLVRVIFLFISWWKFWFLVVTIAVIWSMKSWQVYLKGDLLGRQTNGRLFYSGIRGDFKKVAANGAPDVQVPGLACLKRLPEPIVKSHKIGKLLESFGAANSTNLALAGTILAYEKWPAFVAQRNEHTLLSNAFQNVSIVEYSSKLLELALSLQRLYLEAKDNIEDCDIESVEVDSDSSLTVDQYIQTLRISFDKVLTNEWKLA